MLKRRRSTLIATLERRQRRSTSIATLKRHRWRSTPIATLERRRWRRSRCFNSPWRRRRRFSSPLAPIATLKRRRWHRRRRFSSPLAPISPRSFFQNGQSLQLVFFIIFNTFICFSFVLFYNFQIQKLCSLFTLILFLLCSR